MSADALERWRLQITGVVQGVGFRPFIYRLASAHGLCGWVLNNGLGVCVEVQGKGAEIQAFTDALPRQIPPQSQIHTLAREQIPIASETGFRIRESEGLAGTSTSLMPDLAPCASCLQELFESGNRRFRYPFINCTHCGPRFSIIEALPYDRANTTMRHYPLCDDCAQEYQDPENRRFHAEPNACSACGPQLACCDASKTFSEQGEFALERAVEAIRAGKIVALKGVGGFQLLVDASNQTAVNRLRARKQRPHKPFALMYPDLNTVRRDCVVTPLEKTLLSSPQRPIVILASRNVGSDARPIAEAVAPANPDLGVMLPSSPLHYLLMGTLSTPIVATSGNRAGEPICIENNDALQRLRDLADLFLWHDRPVVRPLDDSVLRVMDDKPVLLRRARGYAPVPVPGGEDTASSPAFIALGADLKNCVGTTSGAGAQLSQHIGDLQNPIALAEFERCINDFASIPPDKNVTTICDLHPGYVSTRWAVKHTAKPLQVQHHIAHFFSCMAEHGHRGPALGASWDGSGYGEDGTICGSEILHWDGARHVTRSARLLDFPLPGGTQAILDPRRVLAGMLYRMMGDSAWQQESLQQHFTEGEIHNLKRVLARGINTPLCSSMGRLFDGVAVLLGVIERISFEGQGAMALEFCARRSRSQAVYPFQIAVKQGVRILDWRPMLSALIRQRAHRVSVPQCAARFHNTLVQMLLSTLRDSPVNDVFLSGGVFQNKRLLESTAAALRGQGFRVHTHSRVPPNDGGIALGQLRYAQSVGRRKTESGEGDALCV